MSFDHDSRCMPFSWKVELKRALAIHKKILVFERLILRTSVTQLYIHTYRSREAPGNMNQKNHTRTKFDMWRVQCTLKCAIGHTQYLRRLLESQRAL